VSRRTIALAGLIPLGLASGLTAVTTGPASSAAPRVCPSPTGHEAVLTAPMPGRPGPLLRVGRTLWVAIRSQRPWGAGQLLRVDARTGRIERRFALTGSADRLVFAFGSLWIPEEVSSRRGGSGIFRLDPRTGKVQDVIRGPHLGTALAATADALWVGGADFFPAGHPERSWVYWVYKIDPKRGAVVRRVRLRSTVIDLVGDGRSLWVTGWYAIVKLADSGRVVLRQPLRGAAWSISLVADGAWVAHTFAGIRRDRRPPPERRLLRIRVRAKPQLTVLELDESPWAVSAAAGVTWVALGEFSHEVLRVDESQSPLTTDRVEVPGIVSDVEAGSGGAWVAHTRRNGVTKVC
jgi:hypothetical protein